MGQGYSTSGYADGVSYSEWSKDFGKELKNQEWIKDGDELKGAITEAKVALDIAGTYQTAKSLGSRK